MREHIRRSLSLLLALAMTTSLLGGTAWAAEETTADSSAPVAETAEAADSSESTEEAVASLPAQEAELQPEQQTKEETEPETKQQTKDEVKPETKEPVPSKEQAAPEQETSPATMATEGTCGEQLTWKLEDGTLTISGTGAMEDYVNGSAPWYAERDQIQTVVIEAGVTSIGSYAFYDSDVQTVNIPVSVTKVGKDAFGSCYSFSEIVYGGSKTDWAALDVEAGNDELTYCSTIEHEKEDTGKSITECTITLEAESYIHDGQEKEPAVTVMDGEKTLAQGTDYIVRYEDNVDVGTATAVIVGRGAYCDVVRKEFEITLGTSGKCGDNATWNVADGVLTISGTGAMSDYETSPWQEYEIDAVIIEDGVTHIGSCAFYYCRSVTDITIGKNVVSIGERALDTSKLVRVDVSAENTAYSSVDGVLFDKGQTKLLVYPEKKKNATYTIPESVTEIGKNAFSGTRLRKVVLPNGLKKIGAGAFGECEKLSSITIPASVTSIEEYAFMSCYGLAEVHISDLKAWCNMEISTEAFVEGTMGITLTHQLYLNDQLVTDLVIPSDVENINPGAFSGCESLTSITIPEGVKSVGRDAFYACENVGRITIPKSVTSIGGFAFSYCRYVEQVDLSSVTTIGDYAFVGCSKLKQVIFSEDLVSIGRCAFEECTSLEQIVIPDSVKSIDDEAFAECSALTEVTLSKNMDTIPWGTFRDCSRLTTITIPKSVKKIGDFAFERCMRLSTVNYGGSCEDWGAISVDAFSENEYLFRAEIHYAEEGTGKIDIADCTVEFQHDEFDNLVMVLKDGEKLLEEGTDYESTYDSSEKVFVKGVGNYGGSRIILLKTSEKCGENLQWKVQDKVLTIYGTGDMSWDTDEAPWSEQNISSVVVEEGVTSIAENAFQGKIISQISLPSTLKKIGSSAFAECADLESITLPDGLTSIGASAFRDCEKLTSIEIPDSVVSIDRAAFWGCEKLSSIKLSKNLKCIEGSLLEDCKSLTSVEIPDGVTSIEGSVFEGCQALTTVKIPKTVTSIGFEAFRYCDNLVNIEIPEGVTTIKGRTFFGCTELKNLVLPDGLEQIGECAFCGCDSLSAIEIPAKVSSIDPYRTFDAKNLTVINVAVENKSYSSVDGVLFNKDQSELIAYPAGKKGTSYTVPKSVRKIGSYAFSADSMLEKVKLQEGVESIGDHSFYDSKKLNAISIPKSVKEIADYAFSEGNLDVGDVYYAGSKEDWAKIQIGKENEELTDSNLHFNSNMPTTKPLSNCTITLGSDTYTYDGKAKAPTVTVKDGTTTLTAGMDYEVVYANNTNVGTAKATVIGKGNYTGTVEKTFQINAASLSKATVTLAQTSVTYTGAAQTPAAAVTLNGKTLSTADYTVAYQNNANAGTAKVTVTGKGNYTGTATATFTIAKAGNTVTASSVNKTTSAKAQSFRIGAKAKGGAKLTYKSNNKSITVDKNGKVTVAKNYIGKATITISAAATTNYNAAVKQIYVTVNPTGTKLSSVTSAKTGQLTIKWAKNAAVTGYQVQYATSGKFNGAKTLNVKSNKTVTGTLSKLKEKQKYYVRIRTYKTVGKVNYYSAWSAAKSATVKGVTAPAAVKLTSVKSAKAGEMTVKWGKNAKAGGYQLQYATAKNFKSAKTVAVKKAKTTSTTVKKLSKGKKYYVRVRTYQKVSGKTYYSTWSASKNVTIKK